MTTIDHDIDERTQLQQHLAELSTMTLKKDQIVYACEQLYRPGVKLSGKTVMDWLAGFGIEVSRPSTSGIVTKWCADHDIVRTADLPALTAGMLAELDAARAGSDAGHALPNEHDQTPEPNTAATTEQVAVAVRSDTEQMAGTEQPGPNTEHPVTEHPAVTEQARPNSEQPTEQSEQLDPEPSNGDDVPAAPSPVEVVPAPLLFDPPAPVTEQPAVVSVRTEQAANGQAPVFAPDTERTANEHPTPVLGESPAVASPVVVEQVVEPVKAKKPLVVWPVMLMALSAFVSIWSGWVGLGEMTGFGVVEVLPGISEFKLNTAITLPIGVEAYASYALYVWLSGRTRTPGTKAFAKWSAIASLSLGAAGQIAYHLLMQSQHDELEAAKTTAVELARTTGTAVVEPLATAPWWITTFVACLPVIVVGMGAALAHMVLSEREH
ncbi:hypothetical protein [Nocardia noduli]|uniref:hypothetical protein n=1 Tax=Nocardia noduli TaxID=2815722 RepID=UPI001C21AEC4|nr:hypothetical protein [Nocardia noduli]